MISLQRISYSYTDSPKDAVLHEVSLEVPSGGLVGIAGSTGSGKSTLLQVTAELLQPFSGTVSTSSDKQPEAIDTQTAKRTRRFPWKRRGKTGTFKGRPAIGLVFQYPERQLFAQTVIDDVMFGPRNLGRDTEGARADAEWALGLVGLPQAFWERNPFQLSGGEQRRAALAGVLAMRPHTLALDEPTAGQDPARRTELIALIERLRAQGIGVLMASHDMDLLALCDRIAVLDHGRVALEGAPLQVFAEADSLAACGLVPPAIIQFATTLQQAGVDIPLTFDSKVLADALAHQTEQTEETER